MGFLFSTPQEPKSNLRTANVSPERAPTNEAGRPLPVFWGKQKLGMTFISGPWDEKTEDVEEHYTVGKRDYVAKSGRHIRGSFAAVICMGPVHRLRRIYLDGRSVFEGELRNGDDPTTVSGYADLNLGSDLGHRKSGRIRFYWGTRLHTQDGLMSPLFGGASESAATWLNPAYRRMCYLIADEVYWGQNRYTAPAFEFELERHTKSIEQVIPAFDESAMDNNDNCALVEVIHDLLTDRFYGAGIPLEQIDTESFAEVHELMKSKFHGPVGVSPLFTTARSTREALADLCQYGNLVLRWKEVRRNDVNLGVRLTLQVAAYRGATATPPVADFWTPEILEEPRIHRAGWGSTWNLTRVTFTDRDSDYNDDAVTVGDLGHQNYFETVVQREFQRPYVTKRKEAQRQAREMSAQGAVPQMTTTLRLKSHIKVGNVLVPLSTVVSPGDICRIRVPDDDIDQVGYAKLGIVNAAFVVRAVRIGGPSSPGVEIDCDVFEESLIVQLEGSSNDPGGSPPPPELGNPIVRVGYLPKEWPGREGHKDGALVFIARTDEYADRASVFLGWGDKGSPDDEDEWSGNTPPIYPVPLGLATSFVKEVDILAWKIRKPSAEFPDEQICVKIEFAQSFDEEWFVDNWGPGCLIAFQTWRWRKSAGIAVQHSITPSFYTFSNGIKVPGAEARTWIVEFDSDEDNREADKKAMFKTPELRYATNGRAGRYPSRKAFVGHLTDFFAYKVRPETKIYIQRRKRTIRGANFTRRFTVDLSNSLEKTSAIQKTSIYRRKKTQDFEHGLGRLSDKWGNPVQPPSSPTAFYTGDDTALDLNLP